jgi:hypothetical protein
MSERVEAATPTGLLHDHDLWHSTLRKTRNVGFQKTETPRVLDNRHMKVVVLSALRTGRLYTPGNIPGTHFCQMPSRPQDHSATERIMSMKNYSDTMWSRTRDLPACSAVPQPTAPPHVKLS